MTTNDSDQQRAKRAKCVIVSVAVLVCVGYAFAEWVTFGKPSHAAIELSFATFLFLMSLGFVALLGQWLYGRSTAGRILVDGGPRPGRSRFWIMGSCCLIVTLYLIVGLLTQPRTALGISVGIYFVVITSYFFVMATGRLQVRDNGLWLYSRLLRWRKIGSYHWMNESTLLVRPKGRFSLLTQEVFSVPPEHRQAVEKFVTEHYSAQPTA